MNRPGFILFPPPHQGMIGKPPGGLLGIGAFKPCH
jgi:hypothetical protein